jgi:hypothetical protein
MSPRTASAADAVAILETIATELDCERLDGARLALADYWANRAPGNGTLETDLRAFELTRDIIRHTPSDKSRSLRTLKRPRRIFMAIAEETLSGALCTFHSAAGPRTEPAR